MLVVEFVVFWGAVALTIPVAMFLTHRPIALYRAGRISFGRAVSFLIVPAAMWAAIIFGIVKHRFPFKPSEIGVVTR